MTKRSKHFNRKRNRTQRTPDRLRVNKCGSEFVNGEYILESPGCYTHQTDKGIVTLTSGHDLSVFGEEFRKAWLISLDGKKLYAAPGNPKTHPRNLVFESVGADCYPPADIEVISPRILLVLDLDETLISTHAEYNPESEADFTVSLGECMGSVYKRPLLKEFLEFAFKNFDVAVWTAALPEYAEVVVENCFTEEQRQSLKFIWTREHCTSVEPAWNSWEFLLLKKHLHKIPGYQMNRILHIDNTFSTFSDNRRNGILVEDWNGVCWDDQELLFLEKYLRSSFLETPSYDVRSVPKRDWRNLVAV